MITLIWWGWTPSSSAGAWSASTGPPWAASAPFQSAPERWSEGAWSTEWRSQPPYHVRSKGRGQASTAFLSAVERPPPPLLPRPRCHLHHLHHHHRRHHPLQHPSPIPPLPGSRPRSPRPRSPRLPQSKLMPHWASSTAR